MPADILHHFLLGWAKKAVEKLKVDSLSTRDLTNVCAILDKCIIWKVLVIISFASMRIVKKVRTS